VIRLLALCGSLRAASTNKALLDAAALLAPANMVVSIYEHLADLPHFNPDLDVAPWPNAVARLRDAIARSDGLLISSPEYARGIPGSLKNALDWLVSSEVFPGKPVALFNASDRGVAMQAALRLTLETMSARMVDAATITVPILGRQTDATVIAADPAHAAKIRDALAAYARFLA
jgi:NAD(P)H-dependent FMN reductase